MDSESKLPSASDRSSCDFCGNPKSQKFNFDLGCERFLRVCTSQECDEQFSLSRLSFCAKEGRVPLEIINDAIPSFLDVKREWTVVRGSGDVEKGWKVARNWKVSPEYGMLSTLRGEPWYRIPLIKDDKARLCLLSELKLHNSDALAADVWGMLTDLLPAKPDEPTDEFLQNYSSKAWALTDVTDEKLKELRL
jgi:hypothetical protein